MRCPNCGADGYRRKIKTPEWRCSEAEYNGGCGHEWNVGLDVADIGASITTEPRLQSRVSVQPGPTPVRSRRSLGERLGDVTWLIVGPFAGLIIANIVLLVRDSPLGDLTWLIVAPMVFIIVGIIAAIMVPD